MNLLVRILVLVTFMDCLAHGQNFGGNSVYNAAPEEKSPIKRFLNLFGFGDSKHATPQTLPHYQEFNPYQYPCAISQTTTTTPAPVVLSPLLCPFPPMVPPNLQQPNNGEELQAPLPAPHSLEPLSPPPSGSQQPLLPPHSDGGDQPGSHPRVPPSLPDHFGQLPLPSGHPPPIFIPMQPGQNPNFPFPGMSFPSFPGQKLPPPSPIHNLPLQPGQGSGTLPKFPGLPSLLPNNTPLPSSIQHLERPQPVDPLHPEEPVKVNPVPSNPFDPIKINPTQMNPNRPVPVQPVDIQPSQPVLIDPANVQPGHPLVIEPLNPPSSSLSHLPPPPAFNDPKAFTRYPSIYPFGPTNVLINPGFPMEPPRPPPQPTTTTTTTPSPPVEPSTSADLPPPKPQPQPFRPRPMQVLVNPGLPIHPPSSILPPHQGSANTYLVNPGIPPENIHLIPLIPLNPSNLGPQQGGKPLIPLWPSFNSHGQNITLPPPPPLDSSSLPPPQNIYGNQPSGPPHSVNDPIASPSNIDPIARPPPSSGVPPPPPAFLAVTDNPRQPCGAPFLKPYVPHGFHLSSVNQFIGMSPAPNQPLNFPCTTVDLLQTLDFTIMRELIISSGLLPLFDHLKNYTLLLPVDAAFRRLPRWFRDSLEVDKKLKKALVLNHLIKEDLPLAVLENEELILSARPGGNRLRINIYEPVNSYRAITVDGAVIEKGDLLTTNGRLHIVNKVIMPNLPRNAAEFLSEKLEFESFWNLVKQADLVQHFQDPRPFTLFIPVNAAIQRLNDSAFLSDREKLRNFISYHVVNGTYYSNGLINNEFLLTTYEKEIKLQVASDTFAKTLVGINGKVRVLKADISLTNGVAHIIDQCISEDTPFYMYPQSDEFKHEYGVLRRNFRVDGEEKNIENAFKR